jgi:hypothetical protein
MAGGTVVKTHSLLLQTAHAAFPHLLGLVGVMVNVRIATMSLDLDLVATNHLTGDHGFFTNLQPLAGRCLW